MSCSPTIEAMKADERPGRCIGCSQPLPPRRPGVRGRNGLMCGSVECRRLYQAVWMADRRAAEREGQYMREFREWAR